MKNETKYLLNVLLKLCPTSLIILTVIYHFLVTNVYVGLFALNCMAINSWMPKGFGYRYLRLMAPPLLYL